MAHFWVKKRQYEEQKKKKKKNKQNGQVDAMLHFVLMKMTICKRLT